MKKAEGQSWWTEILLLLFSTALLAAMIILFWKLDGTELNAWSAAISINSVTSILSVAFQIALMGVVGSCLSQGKWTWFRSRAGPIKGFLAFDDASRGPLGAISLLWWLKSLHWPALGAWVMLLMLGFDPFLQAVIDYDGDLVVRQGSNSTLGRSGAISFGSNLGSAIYSSAVHNIKSDIGFSSSILAGFSDSSTSNTDQPPSLSCNTGNCTWAEYSTIEICSSCVDISSKVVASHGVGNQANLPDCNIVTKASLSGNYTTYTLPYSSKIDVFLRWFNGFKDETACGPLNYKHGMLTAVFEPNATYNFKEWDTMLAAFAFLRAPDPWWDNQTRWDASSMQATECALRYCSNAYNATMSSGKVKETPIPGTSFQRVKDSYQLKSPGVASDWDIGSGLVRDSPAHREYNTPNTPLSVTNKWSVDYDDRLDLQLALQLPAGSDLANKVQTTFNITQLAIESSVVFLTRNDTLDMISASLIESSNLTATFEHAARIMSLRLRQNDGNITSGEVEEWVVFVRMQWPYLAFPVAMYVLAVIYALGMMFTVSGHELKMTKGELLPVMLHGLNDETKASLNEMKLRGENVTEITIKLKDIDSGVQLERVSNHEI
ncbi:hypothetical protein GQ53DRAFT_741222 [Thozetella sp. PMI_491]|nr:hypothetical protein GQ53DRAFT_741222 [Thozetella sp. PMI_491]